MSKKVRIGRMVKIDNKNKKKFSTEAPVYFAVMVKYKVDGVDKVRNLLFTDWEMERASVRAERNKEELLVQSSVSKIVD